MLLRNLLGLAVATAILATASAIVIAQPGYDDSDQLEPGVLAPQDEPDYGLGLERGVLGTADELEHGLIGLDDPIFAPPPPPPRARLRPPGWYDDRLEHGLIGLDDPIFTRAGRARGSAW